MNNIFGHFPILLPKDCDYKKWAVIACDQFTTNKQYWNDLATYIGEAPSTLHLTFPEIFLKEKDIQPRIDQINSTMKNYIGNGIFKEIPGMVLVERTFPDNKKRIGMLLSVDLERYNYQKADVPIRATEATIVERLPVRMQIKEKAAIELPHILLLIDDQDKKIIEPIYSMRDKLNKLYDFDLNQDGGHICGYHVPQTDDVENKMLALLQPELQVKKYGHDAGILFAVGDGNHSMASAKEHWNIIKQSLSEKERENHPARYILVEVVNLYQDSMDFHPIHRIIMNCPSTEDFIASLQKHLTGNGKITVISKKGEITLSCPENNATTIRTIQEFISEYKQKFGAELDYEHSEKQARLLASTDNTVSILMPTFDKKELFNYVVNVGNLPLKAFSIGTEETKRYYIEAKRITL